MYQASCRPSGRGRHSNTNPQQALFRAHLNDLRTSRGYSQNALALAVGVNPSFINRLLNGLPINQPIQATRAVALQLADVLELGADETDRLLWLAGHAPVRDYQTICNTLRDTLEPLAEFIGSARGQLTEQG